MTVWVQFQNFAFLCKKRMAVWVHAFEEFNFFYNFLPQRTIPGEKEIKF